MMSFSLDMIIFTIVNFMILLFIVKKYFFQRVEAIIEEREAIINEKLDNADSEVERARMMAIENERLLNNAREEGKKITERQKQKAEKIYQEIVDEAHDESKVILERARVEIGREREKVEYQLRKEAVGLAIELSKKVIEKNIDEEKNRDLIGDFISKVGS